MDNPVNQYLVKLAWGWTCCLVLLHHLQETRGPGQPSLLTKVARLGAGSLVWYLGARLAFPWLEERTGVCPSSSLLTRRTCFKAGFQWTGFDISGHCFLLTFNNLFILEEVQEEKMKEKEDQEGTGDRSGGQEVPLSWSRLILCVLMVAWDVMVVCTCLYFHTTLEKMVGMACGLLAWHLLFRMIYPLFGRLGRQTIP